MLLSGRLVISGPCAPAFNMACDQALGLCAARPVLRFYQWEPAAVSLGYFQTPDEVLPFMEGLPANIPLVRRITGGGAIYHCRELTYALIAPAGMLDLPARMADSYRHIHAPFIRVLREFGVEAADGPDAATHRTTVCFDSITPYDVSVRGRKIMGSAQRRHRQFFLQHGSLPLEANPFATRATSIAEELGRPVDACDLAGRLAAAISAQLRIALVPSMLTTAEAELAARLEDECIVHPLAKEMI